MPLRPIRPLLTAIAALCCGVAGANDLNWMTAKEMARLPEDRQREVPAWCGGIYYNPALADFDPAGDTVITADQSKMIPGGEAELSGKVLIEQPGRVLRAERARFNQETGEFELSGNIHVELPDATFNAEGMTGNSKDRQAKLEKVEYAVFPIHGRGKAEGIEQAEQVIRIRKGSYTTCQPGSDGWRLEAGRIELDREKGWGTARNVLLKVEGIPVAWIPWFTFPIDERRKTGLLFPSITSSDAGGVDITQPIYLNLHPQLDATLAPRHIHGRGNGLETEVRYLTGFGEGSLSHAWLRRDRLFDDEERELARWHHNGSAGPWQLYSDVNYVSDDFYFKDLDTGLQVSSQTHLPRTGSASYLDRDWNVLVRAQSWQTIDPNLPEADYPYRRLPQFQASGDPTLFGPLRLLWLSDFTRFDRNVDLLTGDNITGKRTHLEPGLALPLRASWGYLEPRVRLYHTRYELNDAGSLTEPQPERTLAGGSLDAGLFLERPFELGDSAWRQTLEPRLFANKIEYEDQSELPDFDAGELSFSWQQLFRENRFSGFDRIGDEKSLSAGLTSRFIRDEDGREVLRLRAGQQFWDEPRRVTLDGTIDEREQSPLLASARWSVNERWQLIGVTHWNTDVNRKQLVRGALGYRGDRRFLRAGYQERRFVENEVRQTELAGLWPVHDHWSLLGRWLHDLDNKRSLETMAGVQYRDCCWMIRLVNHRELSDENGDGELEADRTLLLQIQLVGLGGFGGRIDSLLEQSLPGYRAP